jgi:hypothetical protein
LFALLFSLLFHPAHQQSKQQRKQVPHTLCVEHLELPHSPSVSTHDSLP